MPTDGKSLSCVATTTAHERRGEESRAEEHIPPMDKDSGISNWPKTQPNSIPPFKLEAKGKVS